MRKINDSNLDGYILRFLEFEKENYKKFNELKIYINGLIPNNQPKLK